MSEPLKASLILDDYNCPAYLSEICEWAKHDKSINITHIIFLNQKVSKSENSITNFLKKIKHNGLFASIAIFLLKIITFTEKRKIKGRLQELFSSKEKIKSFDYKEINLTPIKKNIKYEFNKSDIRKIKDEGFDLIIRGTSKILSGEILTSSRFGILSIHHGDYRKFRGGPSGFWEVFLRNSQTGFTIQILSESLDAGKIQFVGKIPTQKFYILNKEILYNSANRYLKIVIKNIYSNQCIADQESDKNHLGKIYKFPSIFVVTEYFLFTFLRYVFIKIKKAANLRHYDNHWNIAYVTEKWNYQEEAKINVIQNPKNSFLADPFLFQFENKLYCFCEEFIYSENKGRIVVFEYDNNKFKRLGVALEENHHLSFPFLFKYKNQLYMCPESSSAKQIKLYKCKNFPMEWEYESTILDNIKAADSIIFENDNYWWMITSIDPTVGDNISEKIELKIFYAENPIAGPWKNHKLNPIFVDSHIVRNGGLISDNGKLYRVCQKHSFFSYGSEILINEIIKINRDEYNEKIVDTPFFLKSNRFKNVHHLDSINSYHKITVFDFK